MPRVVDRVTPILLNHHLRLSPLMTSPATIFDTLPLSFKDVPSKEGVDTRQFLDAVASLVVFLNTTLSSASINNFGKSLTEASKVIEGELADFPVEAATLQSMVEHEGRPGDSSDNRGASTALLWMNRSLKFLSIGLQSSLANPSESLVTSFSNSYKVSLKPHHPLATRTVVGIALKVGPSRKDFYPKLGSAPQGEQQLARYVAAMDRVERHIDYIFEDLGYKAGL